MLTKFESKTARVKGLSFHPKRPWILTSLHNGAVQIWDYRMGTVVDTFNEHEGPVRGCAFHPTQPLFATCGDDNQVRVFNYQQKKCLFTLSGHQDYIRTVAFHHECPWLMTASDDQTIRIWNWQSRACIAQLTGHSHYVMCAQFHPKDDLVVSASLDQTIRVWDIGFLRRKGSLTPNEGASPRPGQIELFASSDGQVKFVLEGHDRGVNWVQFHPSKPLIVSGSDDRTVKLWRYNDSRAWETDTFRGHFNNVSCVVFHPTAELVLSASEDKTIRIWDYAKRGSQAQTFRRDNDRYWMLAVHPTLGTFAAGHDSGFQVFKLERERPPHVLLDNDGLFFIRGNTLLRRDLSKPTGGETNLVTLAQAPVLPAILDYSAADKAFILASGQEWELISRASKQGHGSHAMFLGSGRFLTLDKASQLININSVTDAAPIASIKCPIDAVEHVFPAYDDCILVVASGQVCLFDLTTKAVLAELAVSGVKRVSWSPDRTRCAFLSKKSLTLVDRHLSLIATAAELVPVKSGVWDQSNGIFYFTSPHHLKYMLPTGETGIIRTIDNPLYLVRVHGETVQALDRSAQLVQLTIDPAEYIFKLALIEKDLPKVLAIIESSNLVGQSVISYLRQHGYSSIALQFVDDPMSRFELALECANWEAALEAATELDQAEVWERLSEQALRLGSPRVAKLAAKQAGNPAQTLFLASVCGDQPLMSAMLGDEDLSTRLQASVLLNDSLNLARTLEDMGLHSLAFLAARSAGVAGETSKPPASAELPPQGLALKHVRPVDPSICDEPWPLTQALCTFDLPYTPRATEAALHSPVHFEDDEGEDGAGGWELNNKAVRVEEDFTEFAAAAATNPLLQTRIPALHLLAGSVESAKKLLQLEAGIVDFEPLSPLLEEALQRQQFGALVSRFEDVQPIIGLADIRSHYEEGLQLTTAGRFADAIRAFEYVVHASLLLVLEDAADESQVAAMVESSREYLLGLRMELKRKELLAAAGSPELQGAQAARILELACLFTYCKLRPEHLILALRSAMTLAFKLKQIDLAGRMARRLVDLQPGEQIASQAQKVISLAASTPSNPAAALDLQFDDHLDFDIDAAKYAALYVGKPTASCPLCGATYGTGEKGNVCRVCRVAGIGAQVPGVQRLV